MLRVFSNQLRNWCLENVNAICLLQIVYLSVEKTFFNSVSSVRMRSSNSIHVKCIFNLIDRIVLRVEILSSDFSPVKHYFGEWVFEKYLQNLYCIFGYAQKICFQCKENVNNRLILSSRKLSFFHPLEVFCKHHQQYRRTHRADPFSQCINKNMNKLSPILSYFGAINNAIS